MGNLESGQLHTTELIIKTWSGPEPDVTEIIQSIGSTSTLEILD